MHYDVDPNQRRVVVPDTEGDVALARMVLSRFFPSHQPSNGEVLSVGKPLPAALGGYVQIGIWGFATEHAGRTGENVPLLNDRTTQESLDATVSLANRHVSEEILGDPA